MIMNNAFTLSTSSNQTYREKDRSWSSEIVSTHWHSNHLLTLLSSESKGPKSCGRAGSFTLAVKSYFHVIGHFWKEAPSRPALSTCRFPTSPTRKSFLCLTCVSSCYEARGLVNWNPVSGGDVIEWAMILVTCSPSWCCCSPLAGVQVIRGPKRKKGE